MHEEWAGHVRRLPTYLSQIKGLEIQINELNDTIETLTEKNVVLEKAVLDMNDPRWVIKRIRAATVIQTYRRAQLARRDFDVEKLSAKKKIDVNESSSNTGSNVT